MKKIIGILIIISFITCSSQNKNKVEGEWFLINPDGFTKLTISKDSLLTQNLSADFSPKQGDRHIAVEITKKINLKDRILLLGENSKFKSVFFTLMTLEHTEKDNTIKTIWNGIDSVATIKTIIKLNENDDRKLLGYNLYSKAYLETLNKRNSIENMDLEDYKKYLNIYYRDLKLAMTEYEKNIEGYYGEAPKFFYQISISSLLEMNYNPIQTSKTMNSLMVKYKDNEEIKEFINKLKEK